MKPFFLSVFFVYASFFSPAAHALFGIPGTPFLPGIDPLDTARELERQQRCAMDRDDANKHQRTIEAAQAEAELALAQNNRALLQEQANLEQFNQEAQSLTQQTQLIENILQVSRMLQDENSRKEADIQAFYNQLHDPEVYKVLEKMMQSKDIKLQQYATYLLSLHEKSETDLGTYIQNDSGQSFTFNLASNAGQLQTLIAQLIGYNSAHIQNSTEAIANLKKLIADYNAKISAYKADWAHQEERKQCRF